MLRLQIVQSSPGFPGACSVQSLKQKAVLVLGLNRPSSCPVTTKTSIQEIFNSTIFDFRYFPSRSDLPIRKLENLKNDETFRRHWASTLVFPNTSLKIFGDPDIEFTAV